MREEAPPLALGLSEGSDPKTEAKFLLHETTQNGGAQEGSKVNGYPLRLLQMKFASYPSPLLGAVRPPVGVQEVFVVLRKREHAGRPCRARETPRVPVYKCDIKCWL